jgi:hypothetical protein
MQAVRFWVVEVEEDEICLPAEAESLEQESQR